MVTSASLAVFLVELLKQFFARVYNDPSFEFSPKVMAALLVVANAVATLILALLGADGYQLPTDWVAWAKVLVLAVLGALVSSALYVVGYAPFREFWHNFYRKPMVVTKAKKTK